MDGTASIHPVCLSTEALLAQCETKRTRRSGPGGQNRNKVETAIVLAHRPTGIVAEASERRTQGENLRVAVFRLRVNLALALRITRAVGAGPTPLWKSRCSHARIVVNAGHDDFPILLAEALDVVEASDHDLKRASERLGCTPSQLTKFLKVDARAFHAVNERRRASGLHPYQ
ncbi:MAG: peptide chain release factor-like protein [Isosphaeraceae bacterium]|nr:peptide chain release factor-like protein [Isosphaeraceae bacterium]